MEAGRVLVIWASRNEMQMLQGGCGGRGGGWLVVVSGWLVVVGGLVVGGWWLVGKGFEVLDGNSG